MIDQQFENALPGKDSTVQTGPELYRLGLTWLGVARRAWDNDGEVAHEVSAAGAAAIASACFHGAHAAAFGQLASDAAHDEGNIELSAAWATAVGAPVKDAE